MINKATQIGLEPTTSAVTGRRSNQLSHWALEDTYLQNYIQNIFFIRNYPNLLVKLATD